MNSKTVMGSISLLVVTAFFLAVWSTGGTGEIGESAGYGFETTSCYNCHNNGPAVDPFSGEANKVWHADHSTVRMSCPGCHGGSAWRKRKKAAHKGPDGYRANPRLDEKASCSKCHPGGVPKSYPSSEKTSWLEEHVDVKTAVLDANYGSGEKTVYLR